jgi:hypothetical protein
MRFMTDADASFDAHSFPATTGELIDEYGEMELDLPNGTETLGDALGRLGEETYQDAEDAKLAARSAISEKGIGRKGYSDRDAPSVGENGPDQLSF